MPHPVPRLDERVEKHDLLHLVAGRSLVELGRPDEAVEHVEQTPAGESRDALLAGIRQIGREQALEAEDWGKVLELVQLRAREAGLARDDPAVLQDRLDMADDMARFGAPARALAVLPELRRDARRSLGAGCRHSLCHRRS